MALINKNSNKKTKIKKTPSSTQNELVKVDLSYPKIQLEIASLQVSEQISLLDSLSKIEKMTWTQVYATSSKTQKRGLNWEVLSGQTTANGKIIASIRITSKFRARVSRDGIYMRFISLHPDHDSAYG